MKLKVKSEVSIFTGPRFAYNGKEFGNPAEFVSVGAEFSVENLSCCFAPLALYHDIPLTAPWVGSELVYYAPDRLPPDEEFCQQELMDAIVSTMEALLTGISVAGVSLSGGLDSALTAYFAAQVLSERKNSELHLLHINLQSDLGLHSNRFADKIVQFIRDKFRNTVRVHLHIFEHDTIPQGEKPAWQCGGPVMFAMSDAPTFINKKANELGCGLLLTGLGADEITHCPRFITSHLIRRGRLASAWRYFRDIRKFVSSSYSEFAPLVAKFLPKPIRRATFLALVAPGLIEEDSLTVLRPQLKEHVKELSERAARLFTDRLFMLATEWHVLERIDAVFPYHPLPAAGSLPEASPFLSSPFADTIFRVCSAGRYASELPSPYLRLKGIVGRLLPRTLALQLGAEKQTYSGAIRSKLSRSANDYSTCVDMGLLDPNSISEATQPNALLMAQAVEQWVRGALDRGYKIAR